MSVPKETLPVTALVVTGAFLMAWVMLGPIAVLFSLSFLLQSGPCRLQAERFGVVLVGILVFGMILQFALSQMLPGNQVFGLAEDIARLRLFHTGPSSLMVGRSNQNIGVFAAECLGALVYAIFLFKMLSSRGAFKQALEDQLSKFENQIGAKSKRILPLATVGLLFLFLIYYLDLQSARTRRIAFLLPIAPIVQAIFVTVIVSKVKDKGNRGG